MKIKWIIFLSLVIILIVYIFFEISFFKVNNVLLNSKKISGEISIVQISDFHNNRKINTNKLVNEVKKINPDLICLTGDIIDAKTENFDHSLELIKELKNITDQVYFVYGNHEIRNDKGTKFVEELKKIEVNVLDNGNKCINIRENKINISGVNFYINRNDYKKAINGIDEENYTILLSHSPNRPLVYMNGSEDLILAGHTHGGQVRLPIVGAIVVPGQGYFPKYDKGIFQVGNTILYIDSGLGCSVQPIRFLNRVQISYIVVKGES